MWQYIASSCTFFFQYLDFSFLHLCQYLVCYFSVSQSEGKYLQRLDVTKLASEIFTSIVTSNHSHHEFKRRVLPTLPVILAVTCLLLPSQQVATAGCCLVFLFQSITVNAWGNHRNVSFSVDWISFTLKGSKQWWMSCGLFPISA